MSGRFISQADTLIVFPGFGGPGMMGNAITLFHENANFKRLIVGGIHPKLIDDNVGTYALLHPEVLARDPYSFVPPTQVFTQVCAEHTKDQANWIARQCFEQSVTSAVLIAAPFHLTRAYLTTLSSLHNVGCTDDDLLLIPHAASAPMTKVFPDFGLSQWILLAGELRRIRAYQEKGDIIPDKTIKEYLTWLEQQLGFAI
ncbi:MAG: hypothetical protein HZC01_04940 [Candidatus Kerfeldbacteria bacterium]|nr:hypothetical protein [Candidatus Kerfeldbacteria bacterium]